MTEAEQIMKRCKAGTRNYNEANNLHAACYGIIGKLLAQQEKDYERGFVDGMQKQMQSSVDKAVNRMAQPEQEPVACDCNQGQVCHICDPITPSQRTWAGLTGEEAMDVTRKEGHELLDFIYEYGTGVEGVEERIVAICKAIEAKLKEKNT